jgi:hypothetical protein
VQSRFWRWFEAAKTPTLKEVLRKVRRVTNEATTAAGLNHDRGGITHEMLAFSNGNYRSCHRYAGYIRSLLEQLGKATDTVHEFNGGG